MLLFSLIILFCQDHVLFLAYPFNRSVVYIIPLLTGVSSKCFHFAKFIFYSFHVQPEGCRYCSYHSLYISFQPECLHVLLVHCNPFLMSFNPQGSHGVPCFYFLPQYSQLCSTPFNPSLQGCFPSSFVA